MREVSQEMQESCTAACNTYKVKNNNNPLSACMISHNLIGQTSHFYAFFSCINLL